MLNPANNTIAPIIWEAPHTTRRTLGVHLAPIGNSATQTKICIEKAETFLEKLKHSKLSQHAKWKAIMTVIYPGVQYLFMASLCSKKELDKIEQLIAHAKFNTLGLNKHFPCALYMDHSVLEKCNHLLHTHQLQSYEYQLLLLLHKNINIDKQES